MEIEYEAKFLAIDKEEVRSQFRAAGATLERPEYFQKRWVFDLPYAQKEHDSFMRVRDEGGIITMTWKYFAGGQHTHAQETEIVVDNFDNAVEILTNVGCIPRSYQESKRELWLLGEVEIAIDTWPYFETYVEIEGTSEESVHAAATKTGFDWNAALFCSVSQLFKMKYGEHMNMRDVPRITFDMPHNPFIV